jgi:hypothetical protein
MASNVRRRITIYRRIDGPQLGDMAVAVIASLRGTVPLDLNRGGLDVFRILRCCGRHQQVGGVLDPRVRLDSLAKADQKLRPVDKRIQDAAVFELYRFMACVTRTSAKASLFRSS